MILEIIPKRIIGFIVTAWTKSGLFLEIKKNDFKSSHKNKKLDLYISVEIKLSYINGLSRYQEELIGLIEDLRGKSWTFKDISKYLVSKGYRSSRDKELSPQLVHHMYKKYLRKIKRENYIQISMDKT